MEVAVGSCDALLFDFLSGTSAAVGWTSTDDKAAALNVMTCRRIVRRIWHVNFIDPRSSTVWCRLDSSNLNLTILSCDAHSPCPWLLPAILLCTVMKGVGEKRHSELSSEPNGLWRTYHGDARTSYTLLEGKRINNRVSKTVVSVAPSPPPGFPRAHRKTSRMI